jgi:hypothetical protein
MFAELRCGAGGASDNAGHWRHLRGTVRLCLFGTSLSKVARHPNAKTLSRRAIRSLSHRALSVTLFHRAGQPPSGGVASIAVTATFINLRSPHQPALSINRCSPSSRVPCSSSLRVRRARTAYHHAPPATDPAIAAIGCPSPVVHCHRPSRPSVRSAIGHRPPPQRSQAS